jgi:multisubunit Na+/H+ antiporter MnhC subunit
MSGDAELFWSVSVGVAALVALASVYCLLVSRNMIRILIALELLIKSVTFLIALGGYVTGQMALAQSLIVTLIVIEVAVVAVAAGVVIGAYNHNGDLDVRKLQNLKG